jgi:toxin FitB
MANVVLDTDVASRIWRDDVPGELEHRLAGRVPYISFVTFGEALRGANLASSGTRRTDGLRAFYADAFTPLPWRDGIPEAYAKLSGGAGRGGHTVPANDCWIAACCVTHGIPLLTLNRKHFEPLAGLGLELL